MRTQISVGNTPLVELSRISLPNGNRAFAKCELFNPVSGSHYDRVYTHLISTMLAEGRIDKERHVLLENSSGTAAMAFTKIAKLFGFNATVVLPRTTPKKKIEFCQQAGAEVLFPQEGREELYVAGTLEVILSLKGQKREDGKEYFYINHSWNRRTLVSMRPLAEEVIRQLPPSERIDFFVPALGNGTSSMGPGIPLKAEFPEMSIIGFESFNAPVFYTMKFPGKFEEVYGHPAEFRLHHLFGTSAHSIGFPFIKANMGRIDDIYLIKDGEWAPCQEKIKSREGLAVGPTSAASLLVAEKLAEHTTNKTFLLIFYDSAENY